MRAASGDFVAVGASAGPAFLLPCSTLRHSFPPPCTSPVMSLSHSTRSVGTDSSRSWERRPLEKAALSLPPSLPIGLSQLRLLDDSRPKVTAATV